MIDRGLLQEIQDTLIAVRRHADRQIDPVAQVERQFDPRAAAEHHRHAFNLKFQSEALLEKLDRALAARPTGYVEAPPILGRVLARVPAPLDPERC